MLLESKLMNGKIKIKIKILLKKQQKSGLRKLQKLVDNLLRTVMKSSTNQETMQNKSSNGRDFLSFLLSSMLKVTG